MNKKLQNIQKLSQSYFNKIAQSGAYSSIYSLYRAGQNLLSTIRQAKQAGSWDPAVEGKSRTLAGLASRLLYNANNFGLDENTAKKYAEGINSAMIDLNNYVSKYSGGVYSEIAPVLNNIKIILGEYIPGAMSAQKPAASEKGTTTEVSPLGETAKKFEMELAQREQARKEQEMGLHPGGTVGLGKVPETIPGPGGTRIPAKWVAPRQEAGAIKPVEETFEFAPAGNVGPAQLAPPVELLTEEEKKRKPWML